MTAHRPAYIAGSGGFPQPVRGHQRRVFD